MSQKSKLIFGLILSLSIFTSPSFVFAEETTVTTYPSKYYNIDSSGKVIKHIFANGIEIATIEDGEVKYLHTDHLGSTNVVTNKNGEIIETLDYFPFGSIKTDNKTGNSSEQRKYIGEEYDEATGLNYLNARYYDSKQGQFLSQDPVFWYLPKEYTLDPQQQNSYSYARNNPINFSDPSGLIPYFVPGFAHPFASRTTSDNANVRGVMSWMTTQFGSQAQFYGWSQRDNTKAFNNAAQELANRAIAEYRAGEPIDLLGYSAGGIVAGKAAQILERNGYNVRNVVLAGTPIRNGDFDLSGVDNVVMSYNTDDGVQTKGGNFFNTSKIMGALIGSPFGPMGTIGGALIGDALGWGEFGPSGRTLNGANNVYMTDVINKAEKKYSNFGATSEHAATIYEPDVREQLNSHLKK